MMAVLVAFRHRKGDGSCLVGEPGPPGADPQAGWRGRGKGELVTPLDPIRALVLDSLKIDCIHWKSLDGFSYASCDGEASSLRPR